MRRPHPTKKWYPGECEGLVSRQDERGGTKSQTGREISCQPQRHRQEGKAGVAKATDWGGRGRSRCGGVRIVRGVAVETVKEGGSKAPGFSRDLCEIPAMPRVKKKTALRCVPIPTRVVLSHPPPVPPAAPLIAASRRLEMEMAGAHRSARWKSPAFRGIFRQHGKKDGYIYRGTDPDRLAPPRSDLPGHGN